MGLHLTNWSESMMNQTLKKVGIINIDASIWSGARRLQKSDLFKVNPEDLPPDTMASLGSMKIFDPEGLKIFQTLKRRAERKALGVGVRFLKGAAVPVDRLQDLSLELEAIKAEFEEAKEIFLSEYDQTVQNWLNQFPEWQEILRRSVLPRQVVAKRLSFDFQVFHIQEAAEDKGGVDRVTKGLGGQLLKEIAQDARFLLERSYVGRDRVTQKAINPIREMKAKMEGLAFVSPIAPPIIARIDATLSVLPKQGPVDGSQMNALIGLLFLLSSEDRMVEHATKVMSAQTDEEETLTIDALPAPLEEDEPKPVTLEQMELEPQWPMASGWF
jgi:hypothetical protein